MDEARHLLRHFLAALAYRTQKALSGAPEQFGSFCAAPGLRTPEELLQHVSGVLHFAVCRLRDVPRDTLPALGSLPEEVERFHTTLEELSALLGSVESLPRETLERLLQGPFADAMTHAGQLAMLRRLAGAPVPAENFYQAAVDTENVSSHQPLSGSVGDRVERRGADPGAPNECAAGDSWPGIALPQS
jgi:hypothetical protein